MRRGRCEEGGKEMERKREKGLRRVLRVDVSVSPKPILICRL